MKKIKIITAILYCILIICVVIFGLSFLDIIKNKYIIYALILVSGLVIGILICSNANISSRKHIDWLEDRIKLTNSIAYRIKKAGEKSFTEIPLGIIVYNNNYEIEWANNYAKQIFNSPLVDRKFRNICKDINDKEYKDFEAKVRAFNEFFIDVYGKQYEVTVLKDDNILFLKDRTELRDLEIKYNNHILAAGIINLDNFEEALSSVDAQERAMKISDIIGILGDWCEKLDIFIRGYSEKQYLILTDREHLEDLSNDGYKVLDLVNDYCNKEGLKITVSISVACYDAKINVLMDKTKELLDLALNRGGNQVVVQVDNEIKYYGGKEKGIDTRLPIYVRFKTDDLKDNIKLADTVLIMAHSSTDADAFGASIALLKIARTLGKRSYIVIDEDLCDNTVKEVYEEIKAEHIGMVEYFVTPSRALSMMTENSLLILADVQYAKLLIDERVYKKAKKVAIIDHHRSNNTAITDYSYMYNKTTSSSSVELIVEMFDYIEDVNITSMEASLMVLGIIVDTNNLIYRTSAQTFNVLSKLQSYGAEMSKVQKFLREDYESYSKRVKFLNEIEIVDNRFGLTVCDNEIYPRQFIAKVADNIISVNSVYAGFCIGYCDKDTIAISARSLDEINVQLIMEAMGGGGHFNNAATQIKGTTIEDAKEKLIKVLKSQESRGEQTMKIILIKDYKGKGKAGDVIDVPNGHGNYLIKQKVALLGTVDNINEQKRKNDQEKIDAQNFLEEMKVLKEFLDKNPITIEMRVGKEGKLFGSVSTKQIVDEYKAKYNVVLDKRKILLDSNNKEILLDSNNKEKEIDALGTYDIPIQLHKDVKANLKIFVVEKKG